MAAQRRRPGRAVSPTERPRSMRATAPRCRPTQPRRGAGRSSARVALDEVVVLDYGGQYSQLIARRVRECGVFSELLPHHVGAEEVARRKPQGLILSGGPASVYADGRAEARPGAARARDPGARHLLRHAAARAELGGQVEGAEVGEFGRSQLTVREPGRLLAGLPAEQTCWMSHRDTVFAPPPGFTALASSTESPVAALRVASSAASTASSSTPRSSTRRTARRSSRRFLDDVCGCDRTWSAGVDHRGADRAHPRAGRRRPRHLRPVRRRRLVGRRAARAPRDRRPAHVRLRRPRPDAQERGRAGHRRLPRPLQGPARRRRRRGALPRPPARRHRARRPSARRSAPSSSASSRRRRRKLGDAALSSSRARCTRT